MSKIKYTIKPISDELFHIFADGEYIGGIGELDTGFLLIIKNYTTNVKNLSEAVSQAKKIHRVFTSLLDKGEFIGSLNKTEDFVKFRDLSLAHFPKTAISNPELAKSLIYIQKFSAALLDSLEKDDYKSTIHCLSWFNETKKDFVNEIERFEDLITE
ncbi:hypothetical protein MTBPR1_80175 [Candidatus Terasakiella magnetica]|uniref:Uncharacterized protein n=1 Tax=Candidatus Terasakiella magnetica TaxID=1867952 RepID=A0A1C3RLJ7_9PROT|nr:hypothetical protein [Candidatus Terasakiella magnetica]SCA58121.1 hypothetical protein MTBPR1_80175 [Candidatus Terasakiella magnetica]